jgi:Flp pilus assembly protein TadD
MPTNEELYSEAERLKDSGDLEGAVKKLQELLAQDSQFALAHSALAVICGRLGRHHEAIEHALKVCELEPTDAFSFTALSVTYQRAGRIPEAEEAMARARMMQMQH